MNTWLSINSEINIDVSVYVYGYISIYTNRIIILKKRTESIFRMSRFDEKVVQNTKDILYGLYGTNVK